MRYGPAIAAICTERLPWASRERRRDEGGDERDQRRVVAVAAEVDGVHEGDGEAGGEGQEAGARSGAGEAADGEREQSEPVRARDGHADPHERRSERLADAERARELHGGRALVAEGVRELEGHAREPGDRK